MCRFIKQPCRLIYADCCPECINITQFVSHNQKAFLCFNDFTECMCLYSCFYPGIFLYLLCFSAIIIYIFSVLYNRLITTAAQCKIHGCSRIITQLSIGFRTHADADTDCYLQFIPYAYRFYIIDNVEFLRSDRFQRLPFQYHEIFVFFQFTDNSVNIGNKFIDLSIDQCCQKRCPHILHTLQHFLIIININQSDNQLLIKILFFDFSEPCFVKHIHGNHILLIFNIENLRIVKCLICIHSL